jgi:hypothetical protein
MGFDFKCYRHYGSAGAGWSFLLQAHAAPQEHPFGTGKKPLQDLFRRIGQRPVADQDR